ncbi:MAG: hypothetical protein AB7G75_09015 [Candidatus Binatia bacterium]
MTPQPGWIIGAAIGFLLVASIHRVEAKDIPLKGTSAGTFLSTRMDLFPLGNPDGVAAGWSTAEVTGNLGKRTVQAVSEAVPTGSTQACPGGVLIIDAQNRIGFGTSTVTWPNGDQLYIQIVTSTQCFDIAGGFTNTETVRVVGGTGKFAGASGTGEQTGTGFIQYFDANAKPPQGFGSFSGVFQGTLILP